MFTVTLSLWKENEGFSYRYSEFDHIDEFCSAEVYVENYDGDLTPGNPNERILVDVCDEEGESLSNIWLDFPMNKTNFTVEWYDPEHIEDLTHKYITIHECDLSVDDLFNDATAEEIRSIIDDCGKIDLEEYYTDIISKM